MDHFDAIVVGSGFGGSVTAYRLAEAGKRVLVLERGRPYPPGSFTRSPYRARESFWDPPHGLVGHVPLLVLPRHRRAGVRRPRRRLAHLRQRVHPQGRELVRAGGPQRRRLRVLARQPQRARPALRPRRADDRAAGVPARPRAVQVDAEDERLQRGRRGPSEAGLVPAQARRHVRQRGPRPGAGRGDRGGDPEPARAHAHDLPARRGVRRRLQLRRQEHARLQLPHAREAPRRGDPHAGRRAPDRAAAGRRVRRPLRRPRTSTPRTRPSSR